MIRNLLLLFMLVLGYLGYSQENGVATYYGSAWQGRRTASGEPYNTERFTAAHKTYPFGTLLKVTRLDNKKSVVVRVIDRGPFGKGRIIDLSNAAAGELGMMRQGICEVCVEVYDPIKHNKDFSDTRYAILISKKSTLAELSPMLSKLSDMNYINPSIHYKNENGNDQYQLCIGPFCTNAEADLVKMKIEKYFPNTFIFDMNKVK